MTNKTTSIIVDEIYPIIDKSLNTNTNNLKKCIGRFITSRYDAIYDTGMTDRIYFGKNDIDDLFNSIKISEIDIKNRLRKCFFWDIDYNPPCVKEPFVVVVLCCIRHYMIKKNKNMEELCAIYLSFSGPFYASLHGKMFKYPPKRECMDYVINHTINNRYDIKTQGSVYGSFKIMVNTWLDTYRDTLISKDIDDDDIGTLIQQLRDRENQRILNVAKAYYKAYNNREFLNYESENLNSDEFRLSDNDSLRVRNYSEKVLSYITTSSADMSICRKCADQNVTVTEVKSLIETIMTEKNYVNDIREVIDMIISDFYNNRPNSSISSIDFISYSLRSSSNTTNTNKLRTKEYINKWLTEKSPKYNRRKKRVSTSISYYKVVYYYIVFTIYKVLK